MVGEEFVARMNLGGMASGFGAAGGVLLGVFIVLAIVIVFYFYFVKYNIKVTVFSARKDGAKIIDTKGGFFNVRGGEKVFKLLKPKAVIPSPQQRFFSQGNSTHLFLYQAGQKEFFPLDYSIANGDKLMLTAEEQDVMLWNVSSKELLKEQFNWADWLTKYGSYMVLGILCVCIFVSLYIYMDNLAGVASSAASMADSLAQLKGGGSVAYGS